MGLQKERRVLFALSEWLWCTVYTCYICAIFVAPFWGISARLVAAMSQGLRTCLKLDTDLQCFSENVHMISH